MAFVKHRVEALLDHLPQEVDGALILSPVNRFYFTGFSSSAGMVLITRQGSCFYTDFRYIEAARQAVTSMDCAQYHKASDVLVDAMAKYRVKNVAYEGDFMSVSQMDRYQKVMGDVRLGYRLDQEVSELRCIKSPEEVERIKAAQRLAEYALEKVLDRIRPGVTEREIALELEFLMRKQGAEAVSFDTIAITGPNTSLPHGVPGERAVQKGDFFLMDFGATLDGYHSDMTRTVGVGQVSSEQKDVYQLVLKAQLETLKSIRAGKTGAECDAVARGIIEGAGYKGCFDHGTGHGVGLEIHEEPRLSPGAGQELLPGMIVTVEPGIYLAGKFGVRIEDMVVVTENGCKNLTNSPKELIEL
ncbi:M24 family metallopeptidase [Solibaculum mannosilyticum]|uniref:M24 family metallopeptidase n=1 Tax=Solibaculum mannosilyticum TaxID=2780922 RepID=UPI0036F39A5F